MSDLFDTEKKIIFKAEELIANQSDKSAPMVEEYTALLSNYKKLFKQLTRLIKINDKQSSRLTTENLILEEVSRHDALTGILNRRSFNHFFSKEWKKAQNAGSSVALMIVDIDYFKNINDAYGHQEGDGVLKKVAEIINASARREDDIAARYGGEEFVVLLPHVIEKNARIFAEKLRMKIENTEYLILNQSFNLTVSVGVSTLVPDMAMPPEVLFNQADKALYAAKNKGRNRVCLFEDIEGEKHAGKTD